MATFDLSDVRKYLKGEITDPETRARLEKAREQDPEVRSFFERSEVENLLRHGVAIGADRWSGEYACWSVLRFPDGVPVEDGSRVAVRLGVPSDSVPAVQGLVQRTARNYRLELADLPDGLEVVDLVLTRPAEVACEPATLLAGPRVQRRAAKGALAARADAPPLIAEHAYERDFSSADIQAKFWLRGQRMAVAVEIPAAKTLLGAACVSYERAGPSPKRVREVIQVSHRGEGRASGWGLLPLTLRDALEERWQLTVAPATVDDVAYLNHRQLHAIKGNNFDLVVLVDEGRGSYRIEPADEEQLRRLKEPSHSWLLELALDRPLGERGSAGLSAAPRAARPEQRGTLDHVRLAAETLTVR